MEISNITKKEQRKYFLNKRNSVTDMDIKSEQICRKFIESEIYNQLNTIMVYVSFRSEVKTLSLIKKIIMDKKQVIVPKCDIKTKTMKTYSITDFSQLASGSYGILEPSLSLIEKKDISECDKSHIDAVITPAVAFDRRGFRLGYGAGYYDRFFLDYKGIKIGFQFSDCICDILAVQNDDIPVDIIYSELRSMNINDAYRL